MGLVGETDGEWRGVRLGFLKGLLETSFACSSGFSGEACGGIGGIGGLIFTLVGDNRGGSGGLSSLGEADLTVLTEAVEEMESELEVTLSFEGEMGDLPVPRSSVLELSLPLVSRRPVGTRGFTGTLWPGPALLPAARSSWELDLTRLEPN